MRVGIPSEIRPGERRVAATPDTVKVLQEIGFEVQIERGAGLKANYFDAAYEEAGATLVSAEQVWGERAISSSRSSRPATKKLHPSAKART